MKIKTILTIFALFLISFASATMTEDLFGEATSLQVTIGQDYSQIDFVFDSQGYEWDWISISEEINGGVASISWNLSDLLNAINFKIENIDGNVLFTEINIVEQSMLGQLVDGILIPLLDLNFSVEDINQNVSLINQFIELDNSESYQSFEKSGNNYIYKLGGGWGNIDADDVVENSLNVFYVSDILNELGIENIYDLNFSVEIQGLNDIPQQNGKYDLNLKITDGENIYNKNIKLILKDFEEPVEQPQDDGAGSSRYEEEVETPQEPKVYLIGKQSIEQGYSQVLRKGESMSFTLSEKHLVNIMEIYSNGQVKIKIQSNPIYVYMFEGEKESLIISDTEVLTIEFVKLNKDSVEIKVKGEVFVLPEETLDLSSEETEEVEKGFFIITGNFIRENSELVIPFAFIIVVLALLIILIIAKKNIKDDED